MGRACSPNEGDEEHYTSLVGKPKGKSHEEDQDVGGWI
jgi:hypothetical protein